MAVKAAVPRHFSIVVFGLTQIAIDLEVLWQLVRGGDPYHRWCHTYLGAGVIASVLAVLGKPASQGIKAVWNRVAPWFTDAKLTVEVRTPWIASASAALLGAFSHVLIDSLSHSDIEPLQPWSAANPFRGVVSPPGVEWTCIVLGVVGLVWFFGAMER